MPLSKFELVEITDIAYENYSGPVYDLEVGGENGDHSYNIGGIIVHNSVCTTRKMTGVGMPQLSAIIECADAAHGLKSQICGDGGLTVPGDFGKAFGGGADFVMVGGMFAGHYECGGEITNLKKVMKQTVKKEWIESYTGNHGREDSYWLWTDAATGQTYAPGYNIKSDDDLPDELCDFVPTEKSTMKFYGMSSKEAMDKHSGGMAKYRAAEGKSVEIPYRGFVTDTVQDILGGLRSTMTYIGAENLKEVSKRTTFVRVNKQINDVFK